MSAAEINKRDFVAAMCPGRGWKQKVDRMPDVQVFAIFKKEMEKQAKPKQDSEDSEEEPF